MKSKKAQWNVNRDASGKDPNAVALGRKGGRALVAKIARGEISASFVIERSRKGGVKTRDAAPAGYYQALGSLGGARNRENARKARLYDELERLGLLPRKDALERSRELARAKEKP